jgi:flagellin-like hook-associated protein FlgL
MSLRIGEFVNPAMSVLSLNKATAQTQKALSRLSSGSRIVETSDDAAGAAVALKLEAAINRCGATDTNLQNADSFLRTQASALDALGKGVTRLMELKTLSLDSTKNATDIANYSAEFSELRRSLVDISNMKFNGIDLFSHTGSDTYLNPVSDENGQQQVSITQYALGAGVTEWLSNDSTFSFVAGALSWEQAKADAESRGGHLATFTSQQEWDHAKVDLGVNFGKDLWLGGTNPSRDGVTWFWVTGEPFVYDKWSSQLHQNGDVLLGSNSLRKWPSTYAEADLWDDAPNDYPLTDGYILERPAKHLSTIQGGTLETSLQYISNCLAKNGAESTAVGVSADNIRTKAVNLESAKSKIADTDVARETQNLNKAQVLSQISAAMIKQSTEAQKTILKLVEQRLAGP